jgi:hypothetical protein
MEIGWCFLFTIGIISNFALQCAGESVELTDRQNVTASTFKIIDDEKAELVVEPTKRRQLFHIPFENNGPEISKCQKGYKLVGLLCALSVSTTESNISASDTVTEATVADQRIKRQYNIVTSIFTGIVCKEGFRSVGNRCQKIRSRPKPTTEKPICKRNEFLVNGVCREKISIYDYY